MTAERRRLRVSVRGLVQGVGFRPFVYRLARELNLAGWVNNSAQGVTVEIEGTPPRLDAFLTRLQAERPPLARIDALDVAVLSILDEIDFSIHHSDGDGQLTALVLPDVATCADCRAEIFDPNNRRYGYPFTNCTNCGPRFTIIEGLPYDRPQTTMRAFPMCPDCRAEYEDPLNRRFHAQPNACPMCGPRLAWWDADGAQQSSEQSALADACDALHAGQIVAVKGLGGFHLMVDARSSEAVQRLRQRKGREEKPFALMLPSLDAVRAVCHVSAAEESLLCSAAAPIVLLRRLAGDATIAAPVAPDNPYLGVMLPYTPLHHLLLAALDFPLVATSGNRSDEPICIDESQALEQLGDIADGYLVHNRPITRHADDSIVQVVAGEPLILRRARGYAPLPVMLRRSLPPLLATGAHQKNTVAVASGQAVFISQHIGDLDTYEAVAALGRTASDLCDLYRIQPAAVACDLHPDYASTRYAESLELPLVRVQHHEAHILACLAEHGLDDSPVLGVSWDGTGYGPDGTIWGGEFLRLKPGGCQRVGHLRAFPLPGGDAAIREPRRSALGLLYALYGESVFERDDLAPLAAFPASERAVLRQMLQRGLNTPQTTSAGRLFDAVAALLDLRQRAGFEGQAAMALEFIADGVATDAVYPFSVNHEYTGDAPDSETLLVDWEPLVEALLADVARGVPSGVCAAIFHNTLAAVIVDVARRVGEPLVALSGGCFQNRRLLTLTIERLRAAGLRPLWPRLVPPNDGGIALGQIIAAARESGCVAGGKS